MSQTVFIHAGHLPMSKHNPLLPHTYSRHLMVTALIALGAGTGWVGWALYCVSCTFVTLSQPAVALAFVPALAGRALSAYNLVIFSGVFVVQWGIGLLVDAFQHAGWSVTASFQSAFAVYLVCCVLSYLYFLAVKAEGRAPTPVRQPASQAR